MGAEDTKGCLVFTLREEGEDEEEVDAMDFSVAWRELCRTSLICPVLKQILFCQVSPDKPSQFVKSVLIFCHLS